MPTVKLFEKANRKIEATDTSIKMPEYHYKIGLEYWLMGAVILHAWSGNLLVILDKKAFDFKRIFKNHPN